MAEKNPAPPQGPTFRVIKLASAQRDMIRRARDTQATTNQSFIDAAIDAHLKPLLEELREIGIEPLADAAPVRLPFSEESLSHLKAASESIGIAAVNLLRICLRRHSQQVLSAGPSKRRGRRPNKKGGR